MRRRRYADAAASFTRRALFYAAALRAMRDAAFDDAVDAFSHARDAILLPR